LLPVAETFTSTISDCHTQATMDEDATQPTQQTQSQAADPRRMGRNNSGLADEDIADLLCILHPCTPAAFRIVAHTYNRSPQNVLQGHNYDRYNDGVSQSVLEEQETFILQSPPSAGIAQDLDLALRFSANVVRPYMGFVFGRSIQYCDIVLDTDTVKRISNVHFRIFANNSGVLMLEDVSTNGTMVDDVVLRGKAGSRTRMLTGGSIIQIVSPKAEEHIKFIVRIPNRDGVVDEYQTNLDRMLKRMATAEAEAHAGGAVAVKNARPPAVSHQTAHHKVPVSMNRYGMHWGGGEKYNVVGQIGKGAFATVYQLATKNDGQLFAAKELEKRRFMKNGVLDRKIDNELQIMKAISHPNVVQYVEYQDIGQYLYIIMEFVPCGDLQQYLGSYGNLMEPLARAMSAQVFDALSYLHKKKITHRDIKPDNILLADMDSANFTIKLSDFGLSKVVSNDETFLKTFCGTLLYCAPEVFPQYDKDTPRQGRKRARRGNSMGPQKFHSYSQSVDIWSYGAVLWFALCLQPPFEGVADATGDGMFNKIMMTSLDTTELHRKRVSQAAIDLMLEMLNTDPSARPSPSYCLSHSWFGVNRPAVEGASRAVAEGVLDVIAEEHEQPSFSKLSLEEQRGFVDSQQSELDFHSGDFKFFDPRKSKRFKSEVIAYRNADGSMIASSPEIMFDQMPITSQESQKRQAVTSAANPKLFGEVTQSALESSGALGAMLPDTESHHSSTKSQGSSYGDNFRDAKELIASPSLLGAESMVREMHMNSHRQMGAHMLMNDQAQIDNQLHMNMNDQTQMGAQMHMDSPYQSCSSPVQETVEPKTPNSPSQAQSGAEQQTPATITPKPLVQPTFSRRIRLDISPSFFYDTNDPSTHNVEYASKVSGYDFSTRPNSLRSESSTRSDGQGPPTRRAPEGSHASSTRDVVTQGSATDHDDDNYQTDGTNYDSGAVTTTEGPDQQAVSQANPPESQFLKPPPRVGKLASTPDSFTPKGPVTLNLSSRLTTWGRAPSNTQVYPDPTDTRVGKRALMLWFHAKDIEKVPEGDDSWTRLPGLHCIISTESSAGVFVNGVHLKRGEEGKRQFGRLYSGDEVVVWKEAGKSLKFSCEFFQGECKEARPAGTPRFKVETEGSGLGLKSKGKEREV
jgi:serine/threonine protein kinase